MNTKQIFFALHKCKITEKYFDGVYASDLLKEIIERPVLVIFNSQSSSFSGKHWLAAFFYEDDKCDFFDSFAKNIKIYNKDIQNFVKRYSSTVYQLNEPVQPEETNICGELCLYFAYHRCLGIELNEIVKNMKSMYHVLEFVLKKFVICPKYNCCGQSCSSNV